MVVKVPIEVTINESHIEACVKKQVGKAIKKIVRQTLEDNKSLATAIYYHVNQMRKQGKISGMALSMQKEYEELEERVEKEVEEKLKNAL